MSVRRVRPIGSRLDASVTVPGSKSIANRALVCAALADGRTELANVPDGDDTRSMLGALRDLGLTIDAVADRAAISGGGTDWPSVVLDTGLAGTTSRFLTAVAALGTRPITIDGDVPLRQRPFGPLHDALVQLGAAVATDAGRGHLPATVTGPLIGSKVRIRGDVSSQYISALMMIGPLLSNGLAIELTSELVSVPYVELTASVMAWFGVAGVDVGGRTIVVPAGSYRPSQFTVEPDASSAGYPLAMAAVVGGRVCVPGLGLGAVQGDARFAELLGAMGCGVTRTTAATTIESGASLRGIDVDMADISDLVPTLAVVAACATSPTRIRGVGFIRAKESDRLGDLTDELRRLGADIEETDDGLDIRPSSDRLHGGEVRTHHDHRLAMAFAVLGSRIPGVDIREPDVVSKSWPGFWSMLDEITI